MKKHYNVNYSLLALLLFPTFLRNKLITAFLSSFVRPLESLHGDFITYMNALTTRANAQVCYMQKLLNDEFDYYERRIRVRPAAIDTDYYLLWKEEQNKPVMLSRESDEGFTPYLLSKDGQIGANNLDFEVVLPVFFYLSKDEERRMKTLIERNKLATKKYRIINGQD
jgi:hypothetical protein